MVFVHVWAKGRHFVSRLICYGEPICILAQRHIRQMRIPLHWTAQFCFVVVAPLAVEAVLRLYVTYVTKRDHLFRSDVQTGWCNPPNLLTTRINATGEEWSIRTDQNGQRLIAQNLRAKYRILILGDSLRRHRHRRSIRRRCIANTAFRRPSEALLRKGRRLVCSSPAIHWPVGTAERLVFRSLSHRKIDRAIDFGELGSHPLN
jgi:hypothetical protein